ncbi:hypothetical protein FZ103_00215 [Streptomonospora sp. PA3]|uniref:hypothetical protein n=1 Tax=Streptomonospora sp. PA3 TaxID=2607326 RepID=UPI0012DFD3F5|nr:hypothetical protein [Streptomonospora sp. PA3]MUL39618.1 hypothetical protein [Streptomonospora sp. PA3]
MSEQSEGVDWAAERDAVEDVLRRANVPVDVPISGVNTQQGWWHVVRVNDGVRVDRQRVPAASGEEVRAVLRRAGWEARLTGPDDPAAGMMMIRITEPRRQP